MTGLFGFCVSVMCQAECHDGCHDEYCECDCHGFEKEYEPD
jgi:hypothetical protein